MPWAATPPSPGSQGSAATACPERLWKVIADTKRVAAWVIATRTSAPRLRSRVMISPAL